MEATMSQARQILEHLQEHKSISPLQALYQYGCFRLASRINELRELGYDIKTTMIKTNGKRHANYTI